MAEKKPAKPAANHQCASMDAEGQRSWADMSFGVTGTKHAGGIAGRARRAAKQPEIDVEAEIPEVQSSSPTSLRPSGGNVEARKSGVKAERAQYDDLPPDTPLLTRVLYHEAMTGEYGADRAAGLEKHGAETVKLVVSPLKTTNSVSVEAIREAVAAIPSKLTTNLVVKEEPFKDRLRGIGMTPREFADMTGTPLRTVENWSRANNAPPIAHRVIWLLEVVPGLRSVLEAR